MSQVASQQKTALWRVEELDGSVCLITLELRDPEARPYRESLLRDLDGILADLEHESAVRAVVVRSAPESAGAFLTGVDIEHLHGEEDASEAANRARSLQRVLERFATIPVVTIACVEGLCSGVGLELVLACDLCVAAASPVTRFGMPETQLGILPGLGAAQRLPRRIGLSQSLVWLATGRLYGAEEAADAGLVHRLAHPGRLLLEAQELARLALARGGKSFRPPRPPAPVSTRLKDGMLPARSYLRWKTRRELRRRGGALVTVLGRIVDVAVDGCSIPLADGLQHEATLAGELLTSDLARSLAALHISSEEVRRGEVIKASGSIPHLSPGEELPAPCCLRLGIVGNRPSCGALAALAACRGLRVRLHCWERRSLEASLRSAHAKQAERVRTGLATPAETSRWASSISTTIHPAGFGQMPVLVLRDLDDAPGSGDRIRHVESIVSDETVIAVDTSIHRVTDLQAKMRVPQRLVGLHLFPPIERNPLAEVIAGEQTSPRSAETVENIARDLGKLPVRVADVPGFLVLRLLYPYLNEGLRLFEEGYHPLQIDDEMRAFGIALGPLEMVDELGWQEVLSLQELFHRVHGARAQPASVLRKLRELPSLKGKSTGRGFYIHRGSRKRLHRAVMKIGRAMGSNFKAKDEELWLERLVYPVIDEAARALAEGVAASPSVIDLSMAMAVGFAPGRGGPLRYADTLGAASVLSALQGLREPRLMPGDALLSMARDGRRFYEQGRVLG